MNSAIVFLVLCSVFSSVFAQEMDCYGSGSIVGAVFGTFFVTILLLAALAFAYKCYVNGKREKHLVLETDPEKGDKYAFDNPCFKEASMVSGGLTPIGKALDKSGTKILDTGKKWSQWSPLGALVSTKNEKKRTVDDTHIDNGEVKLVSLRSHDFTGLGFNICGNMRDGIFIKDVLHRGPASESGKLNPGDRIKSVRISFEHMVYEDALTILSYASPYEVEIEARGHLRGQQGPPGSGGQGAEPKHPIYRSSSSSDLVKIGKSVRQRLFLQNDMDTSPATDYSTLQISSNNTTLERGQKSPKPDVNSLTKPERVKKSQNTNKSLSPEQLKTQLEMKISQSDPSKKVNKVELEKQTEADNKNRFQKFGVRVLPMDMKTSPKSSELSQNDNNINQERQLENGDGKDEVDKSKEAPTVRKREKIKNGDICKDETETDNFERQNSITGSGIRRDKSGIPLEIPDHMLQAAVSARKNRKNNEVVDKPIEDESEVKTPKKLKGKAPAPPKAESENLRLNFTNNFDEISTLEDSKTEIQSEKSAKYCSDSDVETDNQSSVNTIELNSSDITIHHADQDDMKGRKTASTGDLSKLQKGKKISSGTLERAQSLDITDSATSTLSKKRKATKDDLEANLSSDDSLYESATIKTKEPRLSLTLEGLDTFQRNRLKKSSDWGNLQDVIMNLDKVETDDVISSSEKFEFVEQTSPIKFDFGVKESPFLTDVQITLVDDDIHGDEPETVKNNIWPDFELEKTEQKDKVTIPKPQIVDKKDKIVVDKSPEVNTKVHNVLWPLSDSEKSLEVESEKVNQKPPLPETTFSLKAQFQEKLNQKTSKQNENSLFHPGKSSQNFIFAEKYASNNDLDYGLSGKLYDTNVSDDIKVSRHSLGSLERPKSDVLKSVNKLKMQNLIASDQGGISNVTVTEMKPETAKNDVSFDMSTASELYATALEDSLDSNGIKNITISETMIDSKYLNDSPSSLTIDTSSDGPDSIKSNTLTFVTEIQVSPSNPTSVEDNQKQEETLKKLPEMKFTTSSYESPRSPEKRLSQIEILRSNFERNPPKPTKPTEISPSKSRIPIATKLDLKLSPERRDGKPDEVEDKEVVEILATSTPINPKAKNPTRNVTVTSIKTSSKIPSGHFTPASYKPPVPARPELSDTLDSKTSNGGSETSFKQWVFNPNESSVTNIVVNNNKEPHK